jgi:uncharacterized repeat protein (TIGR03803 family)
MKKPNFAKTACMTFAIVIGVALATASQAQTFTTVFNFDVTDGSDPSGSLVQGASGNLYGVTKSGGVNSEGTFFEIAPAGVLTTLYNFCSQPSCTDGQNGIGLILGADGNFYGTTGGGGVNGNFGTIFKMTPTGTITTLHSFDYGDGSDPNGSLVQAHDGVFYGVTHFGGTGASCNRSDGCGTIFAITPTGRFNNLYNFCSQANCTDGDLPESGLLQASDGNLYGTTNGGGTNSFGLGTAYKITPAGKFSSLYSFCSLTNCDDGEFPDGGLVEASNGLLYGTTNGGGTHSAGTVFAMTPGGVVTTIHNFCSAPNCNDGSQPAATLIQGTNGNLFGTTVSGGAPGYGVAFELSPAGRVTTLQIFDDTNGGELYSGMVQATSGIIYGTTTTGGANGGGTIYSVSLAP